VQSPKLCARRRERLALYHRACPPLAPCPRDIEFELLILILDLSLALARRELRASPTALTPTLTFQISAWAWTKISADISLVVGGTPF